MKKLALAMLLCISTFTYAQKEVTKFLGIPVDGSKPAMIEKLKAKGFKYNQRLDYLTGEFNGCDVNVYVVTNNNKVYRICLIDKLSQNETGIRIRFNNLIRQFNKSTRYIPAYATDPTIDDNEDISYEMSIQNKRYEAAYFQKTENIDTLELKKITSEKREQLLKKYSAEQLETPSEDVNKDIEFATASTMYELFSKRPVWFLISEKYGEYRINMFYDNEYNHSDGEDL